MSPQDWSVIRRHVPNYLTCPYMWAGIILGSVSGVILLETILHMCQR
jgi:hypothetical protein